MFRKNFVEHPADDRSCLLPVRQGAPGCSRLRRAAPGCAELPRAAPTRSAEQENLNQILPLAGGKLNPWRGEKPKPYSTPGGRKRSTPGGNKPEPLGGGAPDFELNQILGLTLLII